MVVGERLHLAVSTFGEGTDTWDVLRCADDFAVPVLMEGQAKAGYSLRGTPGVAMPVLIEAQARYARTCCRAGVVAVGIGAEGQAKAGTSRALLAISTIAAATSHFWSWVLTTVEIPVRVRLKRQIRHDMTSTNAVGSVLRLRVLLAVEGLADFWYERDFDGV